MNHDTTRAQQADDPAAGNWAEVCQAFVDASDDVALALDLGGRVLRSNRNVERVFGHGRDELVGLDAACLFPEHFGAVLPSLLDAAADGDGVDRFEVETRRRDGMPIAITVSLRAVLDRAGDPVGTMVLVRDVTEQRLAQATLAEVQARLRLGEELTGVGSWLWDVGTGAVQWTAQAHRIHEIDPTEFEGTIDAHLALAHPDDRQVLKTRMERSVVRGDPLDLEYRIVRPSGEVRRLYLRGEGTIGSGGEVVGLRGILQDLGPAEQPEKQSAR